jgi:hypothetical protein
MSSRRMRLLPRAALRSDSEQFSLADQGSYDLPARHMIPDEFQ